MPDSSNLKKPDFLDRILMMMFGIFIGIPICMTLLGLWRLMGGEYVSWEYVSVTGVWFVGLLSLEGPDTPPTPEYPDSWHRYVALKGPIAYSG